jgi:hypothetical protein
VAIRVAAALFGVDLGYESYFALLFVYRFTWAILGTQSEQMAVTELVTGIVCGVCQRLLAPVSVEPRRFSGTKRTRAGKRGVNGGPTTHNRKVGGSSPPLLLDDREAPVPSAAPGLHRSRRCLDLIPFRLIECAFRQTA